MTSSLPLNGTKEDFKSVKGDFKSVKGDLASPMSLLRPTGLIKLFISSMSILDSLLSNEFLSPGLNAEGKIYLRLSFAIFCGFFRFLFVLSFA